jgi:hypothetical protein
MSPLKLLDEMDGAMSRKKAKLMHFTIIIGKNYYSQQIFRSIINYAASRA